MKYKIELLIVASVFFCLLLAQAAPAGNTMKTLYIDGVKVNETNDNTSGLTWPEPPKDRITIGAENDRWYLYNEYIGKIDDFAVYAGVLSATRIKAHYDANADYTAYKNAVQADAPLLWLRFDDASVANEAAAENSGSIGIDGNYVQTGGSPFTQVPGFNADSNALNFPDTVADAAGHCVDMWDGNGDFGEDLDGDVTVELWVNFTDIGNPLEPENDWPRFYQHGGGYGLMVSGPNELGIQGGDATNYIGFPDENDINDGQWHHIVVTYDSTYGAPNLPPAATYVEEVNKDNPVLWLRFEDTQPKDYSVADGNHWVGYGTALSIVDKVGGIGKSAYLNGPDDGAVYCAAATNNPNAPPLVSESYEVFDNNYAFAPNDITFEMWYKTLPTGQPQPGDYGIFFQQLGSDEPRAPGVSNSGGTIRVFCGSDTWYSGVSSYFDQKWHQLVVTYDEEYEGDPCSMHVQLYLDGIKKGDANFTGTGAKLGPELSHVMVGAERDIGYTWNPFRGYVDEFAIYAGILDPNRVLTHYSAWQPHNCAEMWDRGFGLAGDLNHDCKVNFADFAELALDWASCNEPNAPGQPPIPGCTPNW